MFWARFLEFWVKCGKVISILVGGAGIGSILAIIAYSLIEMWPFAMMDNYLDDQRLAKKERCWKFRGIWLLRRFVLAPLTYLLFASLWYGFHGGWLGFLIGGAVVAATWWLKDNIFIQLAH